jgi:uncharacterized protein (TIGR03435 family)
MTASKLIAAGLIAYWATSVTCIGQQPAARQGQFEVVAVKRSNPDSQGRGWRGTNDRITIQNYSLRQLIAVSYGLKSDAQVLNGPDWINKQRFDIAAKIDDADVDRFKNMDFETRNREVEFMMQAMLAERFHLKVTVDTRILPIYALVVAKSGPKLTPLAAPAGTAETRNRSHSTTTNNGHLTAKAISMDSFADYLTTQPEMGDRVVRNQTALSGNFDFTLNWTEDRGSGIPGDAALPGIFTALQEQMGLELKPDKGSVPVIIVDAVSEPDPD